MEMENEKHGGNMRHSVEKLEYVEDLAAYIEEHLGEALLAGMLAERGFVSKGKLYRDFLNATGHTVQEYIRKRRLSNALALLKNSDLSYAEIAYECGYSSQQAMCRSIRAFLDMSPGQYRQAEDYYFFPAYQGGAVFDIHVGQLTVPPLFGFKFYQRSPLGIENRALAVLFEKVPDFSGRLFGRNGQQRGAFFCYELYVTESKVCEKLLEICQKRMPSFPGRSVGTKNISFVKDRSVSISKNITIEKSDNVLKKIDFSKENDVSENNNILKSADFLYEVKLEGKDKIAGEKSHERIKPEESEKSQGKIKLEQCEKSQEKIKPEQSEKAQTRTNQKEKIQTQKSQKPEEKPQGWFEKGIDIPEVSGLFALTEVNNQENDINDAWDYLCQNWLSFSMYEQDGVAYLEEYNLHHLKAKTLKLMLPIRVTKDYPKITVEKAPERSYIVAAGYGLCAQKQAAETMGHFLDQCQLEHIRKKREFFYQEDTVYDKLMHHLCTRFLCGVSADGFRQENLEKNKVWVKTCGAGYYIVMRGKMPGEISIYQEMLTVFAEQNHLPLEKDSIFCLVCVDDGFHSKHMEFHGKIRFRDSEQNDNTAGEDSDKIEP